MFLVVGTNGTTRWVDRDTVRELQKNGKIACMLDQNICDYGEIPPSRSF
ncbi:MAG: hypothetical protein ACYDHW_14635 [Syntrophorhabdaceae bacterium]